MLYDPDRPKISEAAQHQIEETRIEKITALTVTKFGTGQFAQRGREITPSIGIGNWIERKLKALPNRPGKDECDCSPITNRPKQVSSRAERLPAGELRHHFEARPNLAQELWFIACSCWLNRTLPSALPHLHDEFEDKPQAEKLRQQSRIHLRGHVTANLQRMDGCHFKATGCVK
jgi:hypothetical protein